MLFLAALLATAIPADSRQLVLVVSANWTSTTGRIRLFERSARAAPWRRVAEPFEASLGRSGLAWGRGLPPLGRKGPAKKEGDGKSAAGIFDLREAIGYEPVPPAGTRLRYRQATRDLRCVDDPASSFYNQLVDESRVSKDWASAERMRREDDLYRVVVWVGHNDRPALPGGGSCIFLHLWASPGSVTEGCTAIPAEAMERLLRWLDPAARPLLVQLPEPLWRQLAREWGLPPPQRPGEAAER